ncbi:hypothetical protein NHL51_01245 [Leucobacter sp. gxy201]|uniref:hypothetical protein n=1 Tax=Leucobacter sp. gxy201 TaxID=2957200 RepID=UPI003DA10A01
MSSKTISRSPALERDLAWLKRVAGVDDTYLARWSDAEWRAWQAAMHTAPNAPNPSVPEWMRPIIHGNWHHDFSIPFPQVAQLWPSGHDWFAAQSHEDFRLEVEAADQGESPDLSALALAWTVALFSGWKPFMSLTILPTTQDGSVVGAIEAFYIAAPEEQSEQVRERMNTLHLPTPTNKLLGPAREANELFAYSGFQVPTAPHIAWGSEWMY